jgi:hypothetical protein
MWWRQFWYTIVVMRYSLWNITIRAICPNPSAATAHANSRTLLTDKRVVKRRFIPNKKLQRRSR